MRATSEEHAWAAGFVDADGYIFSHDRKRRSPEVGIQVYQRDRPPLDKLQAMYGGSIARRDGRGQRNDGWSWRIHGGEAVRYALEHMVPHLVLKAERGQRVLELARAIPGRGGRELS